MLIYICLFLFISIKSFSRIINETSVTSNTYENIVNFYCDQLKDRGINLDIYYTLSLSNKNWANDLTNRLNSIDKNKNEQILGVFLIDKGVIQFKVNSNIINVNEIDELTEKYFQFQIDNMEYLMKNGDIVSKVTLNDIKHLSEQMILASLSLLIGICKYKKINLNISENILGMIKDPDTFNEKLETFLSKKETKENIISIDKGEDEGIKEDTSIFKINSSINVKGYYTQNKGHNRIDPLTKLNEYNHVNRKELDLITSIRPSFEYNNVLVSASLAIPYYINDLSTKNNENILNSRIDFIKSIIKYSSGEFKLLLGEVNFKHSKNILNYNLRGYQIFSLFEFKDKTLFLDYIYIPEGGFLGYENRYKKQKEMMAISLGIKNERYNFKYIFSESSKLSANVQEFLFDTKIKYTNIENIFHIFYSISNDQNIGIGNRWKVKYSFDYLINKQNRLKSNYFIQNFSSEYSANAFADNYYKTDISKYIDKKNSQDQYGFGGAILADLLNNKLLSELMYEYYKKRDLDLVTYLFSFNNRVILNNYSIINKTYLEKNSFETKKFFLLKSKCNIKFYNYSGYFIPEYEYKEYISKDIYSKHEFQISEKGNYENIRKKYSYSVSSNSNASYSINPDQLFILSLNNGLFIKKDKIIDFFINFISLNKKNSGDKTTLHCSMVKKSISDNLLFNIFDIQKLEWNIKTTGLMYNSNIKYHKNIKKGSFNLYLPFTMFDMDNQITINIIKSIFNDKTTLINEVEMKSIKQFNRVDLRANLKYNIYSIDEYDSDFKEFDSFEKDKTINDKSNMLINNFNKDSMELDSNISKKTSTINIKGLVDLFVNSKKSFANLSVTGGAGLEKILKENTNSLFIEMGFNININISKNIKAKNSLIFDFHSNYKKVFNNTLGIYVLNEYMKNATILAINNNNSKWNINLLSKGSIFYSNKFDCEYLVEYINQFDNESNNKLKIEVALKTNIIENKESNFFINSSNAFIKTSINKLEKKNLSYSLFIGGHTKMLNGYNELIVNGIIVKNSLNNESSNILLEDRQKIKNNIYILTKLKYISNILKNNKDFTIYNFSLGINLSKCIIDNLALSLNISKELHQYPDEFKEENKEIVEGGINVSYFI